MRRALSVQKELNQIRTVEDLTSVFEGIASLKISKIRNRVVTSKDFFAQLWLTYLGLRLDPKDRLARIQQSETAKDVFLAVTAEGKLSGELDEQVVESMLQQYTSPEKADIIIMGTHGLTQLQQRNIGVTHGFHLPTSDVNFNVGNIIEVLNNYNKISVFYQTYESLRVQKVAHIELISAVRELSEDIGEDVEVVSSRDYIFEPSIAEIAEYLEKLMMGVALIQVIMESKLAQYASRFNAMNAGKHRANELAGDSKREYYRSKRAESDERLKEIMKVVKSREHRRTN